MKYDRNWVYLIDHDVYIGVAPKCGTSSVNAALENIPHRRCWRDEKILGRKVWIVRDPVKRFISLWRNKCRDKGKLRRPNKAPLWGWSIDQLLDFLELTDESNGHWDSQVSQLGDNEAELIPLPYLSEWWESEGLGEIEKKNATSGDVELTEKQLERICKLYREDRRLYNKAVEDYVDERIQREVRARRPKED
jgi:hypothetical protein